MKIGFAGLTHLGVVHLIAAVRKGFEVSAFDPGRKSLKDCELVFVTQDVDGADDQFALDHLLPLVFADVEEVTPVVIMSQVEPGYTRRAAGRRRNLFYQANTLIMNCALERAMSPEQIIVGCAQSEDELPWRYRQYLGKFNAPVRRMSYESAEFAKLAINYMLGAQIDATNTLAAASEKIGASWSDVVPCLRADKRIGPHAYLRPGAIGGHLPRDIERVRALG